MITKATDKFPTIVWELGDLLDRDFEERMEVFDVRGFDITGREYSASAYYFCGDLDEIKDIEIV